MSQIATLQDRDEVLHHIQKVQQSFRIKVPDLPEYFPWLNVERPLTAADLRGRVVLLNFWTYSNIRCTHILPDLKFLEQKYADRPFVVIGVHSAKFINEEDVANVRQALLRDEIEYPVIVDKNHGLWQSFHVHTWPTLVLIDPEGYVEAVFSGEGNRDTIDLYVDVLLEQYERQGDVNRSPLPLRPEAKDLVPSVLRYPGKIAADPERGWLFISDTGHHRILAADPDGRIVHVIGASRCGFADGDFQTAQFARPQGLAVHEGKLLVADTGNHAIRLIDFATRQVRTLAGTGERGHYYQVGGHGPDLALSSPWDLRVIGRKCYIAMAGSHQIWVLDLADLAVDVYAGSGQEARTDGARKKASFAQPSGLAVGEDGRLLFVADSEAGAVRQIDLERNGNVTTLAGGDLFDFGDEDETGPRVRLQHPLGIEFVKGSLYLADTYNHKIKIIDPRTRQTRSYLGSGTPGFRDGLAPKFYEPGGLAALDDRLYVADTNNHRIRVIDLQTHEVATLAIKAPREATPAGGAADEPHLLPVTGVIHEKAHNVVADGFILRVNLDIPPGQQFTPAAPFRYLLLGDENVFAAGVLNQIQSPAKPTRQFEIPIRLAVREGRHPLRLQLQYFYCDKGPVGTCKMRTVEHRIPIDVHRIGETEVVVQDSPR